MIRLLIKTHNKTGLKYLCKTEMDYWEEYCGSGKYWRNHLAKHGEYLTTELIFETECKKEFKEVAKQYSILWNIVESSEWANLRPEEGDGGDTVSGKFWITNGIVEKYCSELEIPEGWRIGRSSTCHFKDSKKQSILSKRFDRTTDKAKEMFKKNGEAHSKLRKEKYWSSGTIQTKESKRKIGDANSKEVILDGILYKSQLEASKITGICNATISYNFKKHNTNNFNVKRKGKRNFLNPIYAD